jgi:hypothetical protein
MFWYFWRETKRGVSVIISNYAALKIGMQIMSRSPGWGSIVFFCIVIGILNYNAKLMMVW